MTQDDCLAQIRHQLDAIQKSINAIEISQGVSASLQQRYDMYLKDLELSLKGKASKEESSKAFGEIQLNIHELSSRITECDKSISQYQGDRKFILGIVAAITVIGSTVQGIAINMISGYFTDLDSKLVSIEKKSLDRYQQSLYDFNQNSSAISDLKDRIIDIQKGKTK